MQCPIDQTELLMSNRTNVEIDYCPKCRGVWLDRGELDKIIERSGDAMPTPSASPARTETRQPETFAPAAIDDDDRDNDRKRKPKKDRRSFLEDLFDF